MARLLVCIIKANSNIPSHAHAVPMLCPCRAHAVPMPCPCRAAIASLPFDLHTAAVFDLYMPYRAHAAPVPRHETCRSESGFSRPRHRAVWARHGHSMACVRPCPRWASSGYRTEFHEGCYRKLTNPLNCKTSSSYISDYHADFPDGHGTVGDWQGNGMTCVN
jgi:hypothetical protein